MTNDQETELRYEQLRVESQYHDPIQMLSSAVYGEGWIFGDVKEFQIEQPTRGQEDMVNAMTESTPGDGYEGWGREQGFFTAVVPGTTDTSDNKQLVDGLFENGAVIINEPVTFKHKKEDKVSHKGFLVFRKDGSFLAVPKDGHIEAVSGILNENINPGEDIGLGVRSPISKGPEDINKLLTGNDAISLIKIPRRQWALDKVGEAYIGYVQKMSATSQFLVSPRFE